jgi:hypothetical protein
LCGGCGVRDTLFGDLAHALQLCDKTSDWYRRRTVIPAVFACALDTCNTGNRFPMNNIIVVEKCHLKSKWQTMPPASSIIIILYFTYNCRWGVKAARPTEW